MKIARMRIHRRRYGAGTGKEGSMESMIGTAVVALGFMSVVAFFTQVAALRKSQHNR